MKKKYFKKNKSAKGYTIIETMIAISIFLIVIVVGVGALLNAHLINKKSQDLRSIMDNLNFSMEEMSRNIRTGYNYHCIIGSFSDLEKPLSCPKSESNGVAFECGDSNSCSTDSPKDQWIYFISNHKLFRSIDGDPNSGVQMTPSEVVLDENTNNFSIIGAESGDDQQPLVIIRLVGRITSGGKETPFSLQTSVSQRLIDN